MMRLAALLLLSAVLLLTVSCGDDGDGDQAAPTATTEAGAATGTPAAAGPTATSLPTEASQGTPATYSDPFAYCAAVGTIDEPDDRWTGPPVPPEVIEFFTENPGGGHFWRCFEGAVLGCAVGADLYCGQDVNTSEEPTARMMEFCRANPDRPMLVSEFGHDNIYLWECRGTTPTISLQMFHVDPRGFIEENWFEITP